MTDTPTDAPNYDDFLAFMTFASAGALGGCECCDDGECEPSSASAVPPTIRSAVDEHLRKRKLEEPSVFEGSKRLHIRQNRELVKREDGFSIWRLDLPHTGGDPIVEYRNNHRILLVRQMNKASRVLSIGQGIIGSAAEENERKAVNWEEGSAYLLPCLKGVACGWIHKRIDDTDNKKDDNAENDSTTIVRDDDIDDVVLYVLKVSPETLQSMEGKNTDDMSCWVGKSYELFRQCLAKSQPQNGDGQKVKSDDKDATTEGILLSDEESSTMSLIAALAE